MKTKLLHLIFCVCAFHFAQVQSSCKFIHTDGDEFVDDEKNCLCGPEKIPVHNETTNPNKHLIGPNSNPPKFQ